MKFQVVVESPQSAVVKATYLNKDFNYVFLDILFKPANAKSTLASGKGEYAFTSVQLQPPLPLDDPRRHRIIRSEFHRRTDINSVIQAVSLEEACSQFFTPFQDTFQIVWENPKQKAKK